MKNNLVSFFQLLLNNIYKIRNNTLFFVSVILTVAGQFYIFNQFMPNKYGFIGGDYSQFFPTLLDGFIWYKKNGFTNIPWFSPSICGGVVKFGNPEAMFYSLPQFLVFLISPLESVKLTFLVMLTLGHIGMYLLLSNVYKCNKYFANFGAFLFSLNSFFMQSMIYGYFAYHSVMLVPLLIYLLMKDYSLKTSKVVGLLISSYIMSYFIYSGAAAYTIPFALMILSAFLLKNNFFAYLYRALISFLFALILTSPKLVAIYSFMSAFPRSSVDLPGISGFFALIKIILECLFFLPPSYTDILQNVIYRGLPYPSDDSRVYFSIHEDFETSIGPLPLVTLLICIIILIKKNRIKYFSSPNIKSFILLIIIIIPIAVNLYTPQWHEILKQIPYIKNSSVLFRWFIIYIPIVIIINSKMLTKVIKRNSVAAIIYWCSFILTSSFVFTYDRTVYSSDKYNYIEIEDAYKRIKNGEQSPHIKNIVIYEPYSSDEKYIDKTHFTKEERWLIIKDLNEYPAPFNFAENRNNTLVHNNSHLLCHETFYGYELENFPMQSLKVGSPYQINGNYYNFKNPACYQEPELNNCNLGDHFRLDQKDDLENLLNYKPHKWNMSSIQKITSIIAPIFLISSLLLIIISIAIKFRRQRRHD